MKKSTLRVIAPLQSWDIYSQFLSEYAIQSKKMEDQKILEGFKKKYNWQFDTSAVLDENYTTIVLTDSTQTIRWVNAGFKAMTGYSKAEAMGNHPAFLQGNNTSQAAKTSIRTKLDAQEMVHHTLLNYKKDGTPYRCEIKIIPLFNKHKELSHFIAFERERKVA